jgi:hypothetical protein
MTYTFNADATVADSDWIKVGSWDLPFCVDLPTFLDFKGVPLSSDPMTIQNYLQSQVILPYWQAAPIKLAKQTATFLATHILPPEPRTRPYQSEKSLAKAKETKSEWAKHPLHPYHDAIIEHYKPLLVQAMRAAFTNIPEVVAIAERRYKTAELTTQKAAGDLSAAQQAADSAKASIQISPSQAQQVLQYIYGDSLATGAHVAALQLGTRVIVPQGLDNVLTDEYWDDWEPGMKRAAELVRDGTWSDTMDRAGIRISSLIDGIFQTATDRFATTLASGLEQGLSSSAIASSISDMVDANAQMIATTETARAQSAATSDVYTQSDIGQYNWLAEDSACGDGKERLGCLSLAENGPYEMPPDDSGDNEDQPSQPWHPNCRCTYLPVIPDVEGENIAPTSEEGDQTIEEGDGLDEESLTQDEESVT